MEDKEEVLSDNEVESDKTIVATVDELEKIDVSENKKDDSIPEIKNKKEEKNKKKKIIKHL